MVLSLAFVLAFIGAAISLLVGILIFSEVSDAIFIPGDMVSEAVTINGTWQYREVDWPSISTFQTFAAGGGAIVMDTLNAKRGEGLLFKQFPAEWLADSRIIVEWSGHTNDFNTLSMARLSVYDHGYHRSNFTEIPGTAPTAPSNCCHTETVSHVEPYVGSFPGVLPQQFNFVDWEPTNKEGIATVFIHTENPSSSEEPALIVYSLNITDVSTLETKAYYSFAGTTETIEDSTFPDKRGLFEVAGFGTVIVIPEVIDSSQGGEQLETAKDTAWTVLAIIPVALFFALFAIFSSFTNRQ